MIVQVYSTCPCHTPIARMGTVEGLVRRRLLPPGIYEGELAARASTQLALHLKEKPKFTVLDDNNLTGTAVIGFRISKHKPREQEGHRGPTGHQPHM